MNLTEYYGIMYTQKKDSKSLQEIRYDLLVDFTRSLIQSTDFLYVLPIFQ